MLEASHLYPDVIAPPDSLRVLAYFLTTESLEEATDSSAKRDHKTLLNSGQMPQRGGPVSRERASYPEIRIRRRDSLRSRACVTLLLSARDYEGPTPPRQQPSNPFAHPPRNCIPSAHPSSTRQNSRTAPPNRAATRSSTTSPTVIDTGETHPRKRPTRRV